MLTRARKDLFNVNNFTILNSKVVVKITILNLNNHVVIM